MSFSTKTAQYSWKDITIILEGRPVLGATNIEYKVEKEITPIYGHGQYAQFLGEGNKKYSGTIDMLQNDYEALVDEAKRRGLTDVTDLEVSIVIAYVPANASNAASTVVDRLVGVKFTSGSKSFKQGETHTTISLPFVALRIDNQI